MFCGPGCQDKRMRTAVVTGTSTGIGYASALRLAEQGHQVVATMRRPREDGESLLERAAALGLAHRLEIVPLDVDDDDSVASAFADIARRWEIDILVNNAGTSPVGSVEEFAIEDWKSVFETNVFGLVRCTQAVLPGMRERGRGHIINVSSIAGRLVMPMFGPYSASKFAVEALSEALALEARPHGIRVALIEPGAVRTSIREKTGVPPKDSPYRPVAKNWGLAMGWEHDRGSEPVEVAERIAELVMDPEPSLRNPVAQGCSETIAIRSRHTDEAWAELWCAPTAEFLGRWGKLRGADFV